MTAYFMHYVTYNHESRSCALTIDNNWSTSATQEVCRYAPQHTLDVNRVVVCPMLCMDGI